MADKLWLEGQEADIVMWGIAVIGDRPDRRTDDPADPLFRLLLRFKRKDVMAACAAIESSWSEQAKITPLRPDGKGRNLWIDLPMSEVTGWIVKVSVENNDKVAFMKSLSGRHTPPAELIREVYTAQVSLSYKLEPLGVEIDYIPPINA